MYVCAHVYVWEGNFARSLEYCWRLFVYPTAGQNAETKSILVTALAGSAGNIWQSLQPGFLLYLALVHLAFQSQGRQGCFVVGLRGNGARAGCLRLAEGCHVGNLAPGFELKYPTYMTPCTFRLIYQLHCMYRWLGQMWFAGAAWDERCMLQGLVGAAGLLTAAGRWLPPCNVNGNKMSQHAVLIYLCCGVTTHTYLNMALLWAQ